MRIGVLSAGADTGGQRLSAPVGEAARAQVLNSRTKQYAEAIAVGEEAEATARAIGDVRGVGLPEAVAVHQRSLTHSREAGDQLSEAVTPGNLGDACRHP